MDEDERVCCGGNRGCRKKTFCKRFMVFVILEDLLVTVYLLSFIILWMYRAFATLDGKGEFSGSYLRWFARVNFSFWANYVFLYLKVYYGLRWICKGRTRKLYIAFYRTSLTSNVSIIF